MFIIFYHILLNVITFYNKFHFALVAARWVAGSLGRWIAGSFGRAVGRADDFRSRSKDLPQGFSSERASKAAGGCMLYICISIYDARF